MTISTDDVKQLRCIECHEKLAFAGDVKKTDAATFIESGVLSCSNRHSYGVRGGLPFLVDEAKVSGLNELLRPIYDMIAPIHDVGVRFALPLLQFPDPRASRNNYIEKLEIGKLKGNKSPKILEVGIGSGGNVPHLDVALQMNQDAELWGVDLSAGMLEEARRRFAVRRDRRLRLALADAHDLPFFDDTFDRVFHVGAVNAYRDPRKALAEMARVAKPGTPIVVVDEELDPQREHTLLHRVLFRALTAYDSNPHAPVEAVPPGYDYEVTPVSRFYYCLKFWPRGARGGRSPQGEGAITEAIARAFTVEPFAEELPE